MLTLNKKIDARTTILAVSNIIVKNFGAARKNTSSDELPTPSPDPPTSEKI